MILDSVDRTVEKFRFSRVRKYFWVRATPSATIQHKGRGTRGVDKGEGSKGVLKDGKGEKGKKGEGRVQMVDNCTESLRNVSDRASEFSVDESCFEGI